MTRRYMLDTNMASYILDGKSVAARERYKSLSKDEEICISVITEAELLYGLNKANWGDRRRRLLEWFLSSLNVYNWDRDVASTYGALRAKQELMGKTLSSFDMQIAAHAVAVGAYLITNDKAFGNVSDLVGIENWATDL